MSLLRKPSFLQGSYTVINEDILRREAGGSAESLQGCSQQGATGLE